MASRRLDRPVLFSNLIAGAVLLAPLLLAGTGLLGVPLVVGFSFFFAWVYARDELTRRQELWTWLAPWLILSVLCAAAVLGIDNGDYSLTVSDVVASILYAPLVATICYLPWQVLSLVIRNLIAWKAGRPTLPVEP